MAITFFPRPKYRIFNYTPRYWDESKERLKKLYEKYGKEYPGDKAVTAEKATEDLKDVATYSEVKEALQSAGPRHIQGRTASYIPGQYIRGAYTKDTATRMDEKKSNKPLHAVIMCATVLAAIAVAYYLSQGLVQLVR